MAIPGYINTSQAGYTDPEYYQELAPLVGILGENITDVISLVKQMIEDINANAKTLEFDENYVINISRIRTDTMAFLDSMNVRVASSGGSSLSWPFGFWEYNSGRICVYLGELANAMSASWATTTASQLQSPKIYASGMSSNILGTFWGYIAPTNPFIGHNFDEKVFVATFVTGWGETPPSEPLRVYVLVEVPRTIPGWELTLETDPSSIPNYATAVRYYMFNGDAYYLISEEVF